MGLPEWYLDASLMLAPFLSLLGCVYIPGALAFPIIVVHFHSPCLISAFLHAYATVLFSYPYSTKAPFPAVTKWQYPAGIVRHVLG